MTQEKQMLTRSAAEAEPDALDHSILGPPGAGSDGRHAGIEFRHLRYFVSVAEELHFGRAAARMYITQPGLSQAIARLEREFEVQLFTRTRGNVELTEAGTELLHRARRLLCDLDDAVTRARMAGRGEAGLVRVGVALLAEPAVAPALEAFQAEHEGIVLDRSAMVSERLLELLQEGRLHAALIHQVPGLATVETVMWEPLQRGRLAVLAGPGSNLTSSETVTLRELSGETFLVTARSLAPAAFEGLKLMFREFGGFDATVLESAVASTVALDTDWRPVREGTAIAVMAEATARAVRPAELAVVPIQPPPQYVLALAWRRGEQAAAADRFLSYLRSYRDQHAWTTSPEPAPDRNRPASLLSRWVATASRRRSSSRTRG
jgi:DNA-binding transcriptional LysR family regulator